MSEFEDELKILQQNLNVIHNSSKEASTAIKNYLDKKSSSEDSRKKILKQLSKLIEELNEQALESKNKCSEICSSNHKGSEHHSGDDLKENENISSNRLVNIDNSENDITKETDDPPTKPFLKIVDFSKLVDPRNLELMNKNAEKKNLGKDSSIIVLSSSDDEKECVPNTIGKVRITKVDKPKKVTRQNSIPKIRIINKKSISHDLNNGSKSLQKVHRIEKISVSAVRSKENPKDSQWDSILQSDIKLRSRPYVKLLRVPCEEMKSFYLKKFQKNMEKNTSRISISSEPLDNSGDSSEDYPLDSIISTKKTNKTDTKSKSKHTEDGTKSKNKKSKRTLAPTTLKVNNAKLLEKSSESSDDEESKKKESKKELVKNINANNDTSSEDENDNEKTNTGKQNKSTNKNKTDAINSSMKCLQNKNSNSKKTSEKRHVSDTEEEEEKSRKESRTRPKKKNTIEKKKLDNLNTENDSEKKSSSEDDENESTNKSETGNKAQENLVGEKEDKVEGEILSSESGKHSDPCLMEDDNELVEKEKSSDKEVVKTKRSVRQGEREKDTDISDNEADISDTETKESSLSKKNKRQKKKSKNDASNVKLVNDTRIDSSGGEENKAVESDKEENDISSDETRKLKEKQKSKRRSKVNFLENSAEKKSGDKEETKESESETETEERTQGSEEEKEKKNKSDEDLFVDQDVTEKVSPDESEKSPETSKSNINEKDGYSTDSDIEKNKTKSKNSLSSKVEEDEDSTASDTGKRKTNSKESKSKRNEGDEESEDSDSGKKKSKNSTSSKKNEEDVHKDSDIGQKKTKSKKSASRKSNEDEDSEDTDIGEKKSKNSASEKNKEDEVSEDSDIGEKKTKSKNSASRKNNEDEDSEDSDTGEKKTKSRNSASRKINEDEDSEDSDIGEKKTKSKNSASRKNIDEDSEDSDIGKKKTKSKNSASKTNKEDEDSEETDIGEEKSKNSGSKKNKEDEDSEYSDIGEKKTKSKNSASKKNKDKDSEDSDIENKKTKSKNITSKNNEEVEDSEDSDIVKKKSKSKNSSSLSENEKDEDSTDSDIGRKEKRKRKKSSDEDAVVSINSTDSNDSDDFAAYCGKTSKHTKKKVKKLASESEAENEDDENEENQDEGSNEGSAPESEDESKKNQKSKRRRIKTNDESSDSDSKLTRKKIKKVISKSSLSKQTKKAEEEERERKQRILEKQKKYNQIYEGTDIASSVVDKLVLDVNEKTGKSLLKVKKSLVSKLKPHQASGVQFMWDACFESLERAKSAVGSGCILAHCMGLGKTLQVITLTNTLLEESEKTNVKSVLIVTPLSTVLNWKAEYNNWLTGDEDYEVFELVTRKAQNAERSYCVKHWHENGGVMIMSYAMFRNLSNEKNRKVSKKIRTTFYEGLVDPGPDLVICDEGHLLKNEKTSLSIAMNKIRTRRRIVLTGTPLQNNLKEYYCMVQFVKPNLLGTYREYLNRFVNPITNGQYTDSTQYDINVMRRRSHVLHKLLDGIVQRRDYSVLSPYLPPKYEYVLFLTLTDTQKKLYQHYLEHFARRAKDSNKDANDGGGGGGGGRTSYLFQDFQAFSRICIHPRVMLDKSAEDQQKYQSDDEESIGSLKDFINDKGDSTPSESSDSDSSSGSGSNKGTKKKKKNVRKRVTRGQVARGEVSSESEKEEEPESKEWWQEYCDGKELENITNGTKIRLLFEILKECEQIGDKVLVFSQSLYALNVIEYFLEKVDEATQNGTTEEETCGYSGSWAPGLDYFRLDGSTNCNLRSTWCDSFNKESNTRARLFLLSTRAGGLGINLVAANRVIIFDVSWNPSSDLQSIYRVYRFGQLKPSYIYRFVMYGTMEMKIYERQVTKQAISKRVIDEQQIDRHYNQNDLAELYTFDAPSIDQRPIPLVPKDVLLGEMLQHHDDKIFKYHEHQSLLENKEDETLNEEERKAAWDEFENEKVDRAKLQYIGKFSLTTVQLALKSIIKKDNPGWNNNQIISIIPQLIQQLNLQLAAGDKTMYNRVAMEIQLMQEEYAKRMQLQLQLYRMQLQRQQQQQQMNVFSSGMPTMPNPYASQFQHFLSPFMAGSSTQNSNDVVDLN